MAIRHNLRLHTLMKVLLYTLVESQVDFLKVFEIQQCLVTRCVRDREIKYRPNPHEHLQIKNRVTETLRQSPPSHSGKRSTHEGSQGSV